MRKKNKIIIYIFILLLVVLYLIIYAVPGLTGALTKTQIVEFGNLRITDTATCYLVREEKVYAAASSGEINYYIEDGVQVRKGARLLSITPSHAEAEESQYTDLITKLGNNAVTLQDYIAEFNGITSYYIDGYESFFTPDTMRQLTYDQVKDLDIQSINMTRTSTLAKEPLYKICDNNQWYVICWVKSGNISKYQVGKSATINLPAGDVKASILDIIDNGDMWLVIFKTDRYYEDFGRIRAAEATIVTSDYNGILIPNQSLTTEDGKVGVYVKSKSGEYRFTPVSVITSDGENTLVEVSVYYDEKKNKVNTVEIYDEILKKPDLKSMPEAEKGDV